MAALADPRTVAADGNGSNGLYTEHLVAELLKQGQPIDKVMKGVGHRVRQATRDEQRPWIESSLIVDFALFDDAHPPPADLHV